MSIARGTMVRAIHTDGQYYPARYVMARASGEHRIVWHDSGEVAEVAAVEELAISGKYSGKGGGKGSHFTTKGGGAVPRVSTPMAKTSPKHMGKMPRRDDDSEGDSHIEHTAESLYSHGFGDSNRQAKGGGLNMHHTSANTVVGHTAAHRALTGAGFHSTGSTIGPNGMHHTYEHPNGSEATVTSHDDGSTRVRVDA